MNGQKIEQPSRLHEAWQALKAKRIRQSCHILLRGSTPKIWDDIVSTDGIVQEFQQAKGNLPVDEHYQQIKK